MFDEGQLSQYIIGLRGSSDRRLGRCSNECTLQALKDKSYEEQYGMKLRFGLPDVSSKTYNKSESPHQKSAMNVR
jgi:hypothetical protein